MALDPIEGRIDLIVGAAERYPDVSLTGSNLRACEIGHVRTLCVAHSTASHRRGRRQLRPINASCRLPAEHYLA